VEKIGRHDACQMLHPLAPRPTGNDAIRLTARITPYRPLGKGSRVNCGATLRGIPVPHNEAAGGLAYQQL
jgi:hypothetical protein